MHKHTLTVLLIVGFIAGCTHTDEYYYSSHGKAVKEYCPAGILQGKSFEVARPDHIIKATDPYNFQVFHAIRQWRDDLSACHEAVMKNEQEPGMFFTDLTVGANGTISKIQFHTQTVMPDMEALSISKDMQTCLKMALTTHKLPAPPKANTGVRVYFVAYQMPGIYVNHEDFKIAPKPRGYVMNTWSASQLCARFLPYDTSLRPYDRYPQYTRDGYLHQATLSAIYHRNFHQFNDCIRQETRKESKFKCPIVVNFSLRHNGTVSAAAPGSGLEENKDIETCIAGKLPYIEFPPNAFIEGGDKDYTLDYCGAF